MTQLFEAGILEIGFDAKFCVSVIPRMEASISPSLEASNNKLIVLAALRSADEIS
jgi:hypothetical protein